MQKISCLLILHQTVGCNSEVAIVQRVRESTVWQCQLTSPGQLCPIPVVSPGTQPSFYNTREDNYFQLM